MVPCLIILTAWLLALVEYVFQAWIVERDLISFESAFVVSWRSEGSSVIVCDSLGSGVLLYYRLEAFVVERDLIIFWFVVGACWGGGEGSLCI